MSDTIKEIIYRIENLEGLLEELKYELSREKLDRSKIQDVLFKCKELLNSLKTLCKRYSDETQLTSIIRFLNLAQRVQSQGDTVSVEELFSIFTTPKISVGDIENLSSYISTLLTLFTHASEKLSDEYYREKLYVVVPKIKELVESIAVSVGATPGTLPKLGKLASLTPAWDFGENWIVAIAYLQALEVVINKLVKEPNVEVPKETRFKDRFKAIIEKLRDKAVELAELEERLPQVFWDLRHKVVHEGYEPNKDELNTIISWTLQILEKLKTLKTGSLSN